MRLLPLGEGVGGSGDRPWNDSNIGICAEAEKARYSRAYFVRTGVFAEGRAPFPRRFDKLKEHEICFGI